MDNIQKIADAVQKRPITNCSGELPARYDQENVVDFGILPNRMFKDSLCHDKLTDLDAKGSKRSVKI